MKQKVQELKLNAMCESFADAVSNDIKYDKYYLYDELSEDRKKYFIVDMLKKIIKIYYDNGDEPKYICTEPIVKKRIPKSDDCDKYRHQVDNINILNNSIKENFRAAILNDKILLTQFKNREGKWVMSSIAID